MPRAAPNDGDKENRVLDPMFASPVKCRNISEVNAQGQIPSPLKNFPSTPASRLPLSDLLGNNEEQRRADAALHPSPEDQISWQPVQSPQNSAPKKTPAPKRKRARSSSPPTTSQRKSTTTDPRRLGGPLNDLTTPKVDPAADLWNRYAVKLDSCNFPGLNPKPIDPVQFPSSPHHAEDHAGNVGGFRRWQSCGTEWPSSKAKKRKINHTMTITEEVDDLFIDAGSLPNKSRDNSQTKIGSLLARIQESLARPREIVEPKGPSSSSPLPNHTEMGAKARDQSSPTRVPRKEARHSQQPQQSSSVSSVLRQHEDKLLSSSGFGSENLDGVIFDTVDNVAFSGDQLIRDTLMQDVNCLSNEGSNPPLNAVEDSAAQLRTVEMFEDDFDEDVDISGEDFDAVASLCDSRPTAITRTEKPMNRPTVSTTNGFTKGDATVSASFVDEFGDDDLDEESFVVAEFAATQKPSLTQAPASAPSKRIIQRYLVQNVCEGTYAAPNGRPSPEKVLLVEDDKTKLKKVVTLRQSWFETRCTTGSYVHVIGNFDHQGHCIIDDIQNILILHPDHLISALVVADSFTCMRKSVLQDRIKATSEISPPMAYGTMLHEIFQEAMQANRWDDEWLRVTIEMIVAKHIEDLYQLKLTMVQAVEHLESKMPELQSWAEIFVREAPQPNATVKDRKGESVTMSVNKLLEVEEHVWSPMYGLKGNIDATVQVAMRDEVGNRTLTVPFEVKTGKNESASHRAQTALYTLLVSDRYDIPVAYGILYYLGSSKISRIPAVRHELVHMIMERNELAYYVRERLSLPPMIKSMHQCNRCYAKTACFMYHKLSEDGDGETSGMREKFDQVVGHLTPKHQEFFKKWDDLLTKEESEMMKFKRELWTMLSEDREKHGRCFARVVLDPKSRSEDARGPKINRFRYTFHKETDTSPFSFNESHMAVGEPIVVSDELGHYALALGYIVELGKKHVSVAVDRRLHNTRKRLPAFDEDVNQTFAGVVEVGSARSEAISTNSSPLVYRLDKDEFSNGLASVRNNLIQIMNNDIFHAREIRNLVIDDVEPRFRAKSTAYDLTGPLSQMNLNTDQREAIEKIMTAEDYALVLGMPGTGKTTTIAHIIRALVGQGKSVLLTSYTHTAVDNILLKIREDKIGILRLGAVAKIHPEVREFAQLAAEPRATVEELEKLYQEPQVVATTCLGISHQIFNDRTFDYCIVDEASQITLPVCLGPIRMAKTFVLVGDHYQLPPLVQNRQAQQGGLDVSLFKYLSERHPQAVVMLRHQYRMNAEIMSVSNNLIYSGRLVCGSQEVARNALRLPNFDALAHLHSRQPPDESACTSHLSTSCWLHRTLSPSSPPVIFLNTDAVLPSSREKANGARITNAFEACLVTQLVQALLLAGLDPSSIGLITLYRSQLALIKSLLVAALSSGRAELLEAHTTDRFQGRDKDVIVISCVRNNDRDIVGELLKDWRRVNVAVTRAKKKLIIVGSKGTLSRGDELLGKFVKMCEENGWMTDLPATANHAFEHVWPNTMLPIQALDIPSSECAALKTYEDANQNPACSRAHTLSSGVNIASSTRQVLQPRPRNAPSKVNKPFKPPTMGRVTPGAVIGKGMARKRPILADIFTEITGNAP